MKKKLLLINAVDLNGLEKKGLTGAFGTIKLWQPMGLGIVAALTPDEWDIELIDENFDVFQYQEADLVGLSAHTCSINRAYYISQIYKEKNIPVVLGGMHATFYPEEAIKYVDIVAVGRAEGLWFDILNDFKNKTLKKIYRSDNKSEIIYKPRRSLFKKYDYTIATIQSTLGCPNNCEFCNIPIFYENKYYLRNIDDIVEEIKALDQYFFLFGDDNFFGITDGHRERAEELLKKMIESKIKKKWWCTTSMDISRHPNLLKLAHKAGCVLVFVGIESFDEAELGQLNKKSNKNLVADGYMSAIDTFHKNKIAVHGSFICGGDYETIESVKKKGEAIRNTKIDNISLCFLTPLPKTKLFKKLEKENRLLYTSFPEDWIYYSLSTVTYKTLHDTPENFYRAYKKAFASILSPHKGLIKNHFVYKFFKTLIYTRSLIVAIESSIIFSFLYVEPYKEVKFFRKLFKIYKPNIKINN